jgi:hypothetical protein
MGITDFFMKMNMATGGKNPGDALADGLRQLGLQPVSQQGEYGGWFNQRQAGMAIDGSAITGAGNNAYAQAAGLGIASGLGLVSQGWTDYSTSMNDMRARSAMQSAQMQIRWWVTATRPAASNISIRRDAAPNHHQLAPGLFGYIPQNLWPAVVNPNVLQAVGNAPFHGIEISGYNFIAHWSPPMSEYQQIAASPEQFTRAAWSALNALSVLADVVCGR